MDSKPSPQLQAVGEINKTDPKVSYASLLQPNQKQATATISKLDLCPVSFVHGEPTIDFTIEQVNDFTREEGLHQAIVMKFSYGRPDLQEMRRLFSMQFDVQGNCNIGQLDHRHLLVRFDLYTDYLQLLSKGTGYMKVKGDEYFFRTFPWTLSFNPKEETTMSVVWISFPGLSPNLFAKKSLLSIAAAVGKPLAVDKATQERTRPSVARVKVLLDILDKHPTKIKLRVVDKSNGKAVVFYQEVVYDNMPKYCNHCKHQGHDEKVCRLLKGKTGTELNDTVDHNLTGRIAKSVEKLNGDARDFLNAKRAVQDTVNTKRNIESPAALIDEQTQQMNARQHGQQDADEAADGRIAQVQLVASDKTSDATDALQILDEEDEGNINRKMNEEIDARSNRCSINEEEGNWKVVTTRKLPAKKRETTERQEIDARSNVVTLMPISNAFEAIAENARQQSLQGIQELPVSSNVHTLKFSSPQVEHIIKEAHNDMMLNNSLVKQPMVLLNTSVQEIPSQSLASNDEDRGHLVMYSANSNASVRAKFKDTAGTSTEEVQCKNANKDAQSFGSQLCRQHGVFTATIDCPAAIDNLEQQLQLLENQSDFEDDEEGQGDGYTGNSSDEETEGSEDEELLLVGSPTGFKTESPANKNSSSNLNAKASAFVPRLARQQQQSNGTQQINSIATSTTGQLQQNKAESQHISIVQNKTTPPQIPTPTNGQQQQHNAESQEAREILRTSSRGSQVINRAEQQHCSNISNLLPGQQQKLIKPKSSNILGDVEALYEQYTDATLLVISQDEQELDEREEKDAAFVSSNDKDRTTGVVAESKPNAGQQNFVQNRASSNARKQQHNRARHQEVFPLFEDKQTAQTSETGQQPFTGNPYFDSLDCSHILRIFDGVKKTNEKIQEETNVRHLPMRVAKQKHAVSTTSKNFTRSKKK